MEKFEMKVDTNTIYMKTIQFIGIFMIGMAIGMLIFQLKYAMNVDWLNLFTVIACGVGIAFGISRKQSLTIDEEGIFFHNYMAFGGHHEEIKWEKVSAVGVVKNKILIINSVGSKERISLPIHTKEQLSNLEAYLKQLAEAKGIEFAT